MLEKADIQIRGVRPLPRVGLTPHWSKQNYDAVCPQTDVAYVAGKLRHVPELIDLKAYDSHATASRHRTLTLEYLGFRPFNAHARQDIAREIRMMVRSRMRPKAIFIRVQEILEGRKTEIPTARTLTDVIAVELQRHTRELTETLQAHLGPTDVLCQAP
jgi:Domain of unknown function (DUF4158)